MHWPWMLKNPLLIEVWTHDSNCQDSALDQLSWLWQGCCLSEHTASECCTLNVVRPLQMLGQGESQVE